MNNVINMKSKRRPIRLSKSRAINQASEVFRNLQSVVWEYITNGLAYTEKGTSPEVIVSMEKDKITFADNGRGMDIEDLDNFFTAHGENKDIKEGNYLALIRGMHGTGSYSVFKFADTLKVTSVKNGKEYSATLTSDDINKDRGFEVVSEGKKTSAPNGSKFEMHDLNIPITNNLITTCQKHVERQMVSGVFRGLRVYINNNPIEYKKPITDESYTKIINSKETEYYKGLNDLGLGAGEVELIIEKTKSPLAENERGIAIIGDGNLLERCQPGIKGLEYSEYIIGEANIENLYRNMIQGKYDPALADSSRILELNVDNPFVNKLHAFIGIELEKFRKEIQLNESKKEKTKFDKEMEKQLEEISNTLNDALLEDWDKLNLESRAIKNLSNKQKKLNQLNKLSLQEVLLPGEELTGKNSFEEIENDRGSENENLIEKKIKDLKNNLKKSKKKKNVSNSGGLTIIQKQLGDEELRAKFIRETATIIINSDFPTVKKFKVEGKSNNPHFISYLREIALTELAIAVTQILDQKPDYSTDTQGALFELRQRINEYSLKFHGI
jgi:hypothetical protein